MEMSPAQSPPFFFANAFKEKGEMRSATLAALWILLAVVAQQDYCVEKEYLSSVVYVAVGIPFWRAKHSFGRNRV